MRFRRAPVAFPDRWRTDRATFRREAILLDDGTSFGERIEPWQVEDFAALDDPQHCNVYLERPRGHSKTFDIAVEAVTELVLGAPDQRLYCVAADEDQGRLLFDDVAALFRRSPILSPLVRVTKDEVISKATGSRLKVLNSNAPTLYGLRPDWLALDEPVEWRGRALWDALWTATGKRPRCRVFVISTSGWDRTSIAWEIRSLAEREENWLLRVRGQCASWISPEWLAQQQRSLPPHVFRRLHMNEWTEGAGAFLTFDEVAAVFAPAPEGSGPRVVGLDLGTVKDRSVAALVRRDAGSGLVVVEHLRTWTPTAGVKVDLQDVEEEVATLALRHRAAVVLDPWQAVLMAQRLRARGVQVEEHAFTGDSRRRLFATLLDVVRTGRLRSLPHDELRRELLGLEVTETTSGWRVDHKSGRHDDHVVAVALGAVKVAAQPAPLQLFTSDPVAARPRSDPWAPVGTQGWRAWR